MQRLKELKNEIDSYLEPMDESEKTGAIEHLYVVAHLSSILALRRGVEVVLCTAAGLLHDISSYSTGNSENHAKQSAVLAKSILKEQRTFSDEEIEIIVKAIQNHTDKGNEHDLYSEILKDADVLSRYLAEPEHKFSKSRAQRIKRSLRELGINVKVKKK